MKLSVIAAIASNGVIGRDNALPWRIPEDLRHFKGLTMGHHLIMGRKTYESLGRLLPGRTTVIVSHNQDYSVPGAIVVDSLGKALQACGSDQEVFVVGGAQLYLDALPLADRLYLTLIDAEFSGDVFFPPYDQAQWQETSREPGQTADGLSYCFATYSR
jgi:dihydrofolate reductase